MNSKLSLKKVSLAVAMVCAAVGLAGCTENDDVSDNVKAVKDKVGYFGHNVSNLRYQVVSSDGYVIEGRTSSKGAFGYNDGDSVQFFLGDVLLGEAEGQRFVSVASFDSAIKVLGNNLPDGLEIECEDNPTDENGEEVEPEPWCVDGFPDEKFTHRTKLAYSALNTSNAELDEEILNGLYVGEGEYQAVDHYFVQGNEPAKDFYYTNNLGEAIHYDYLDLLGQHSFLPKAGKYVGMVTPKVEEDTQSGVQCYAGKLSVELAYVSPENGDKELAASGVLKLADVSAFDDNEDKVLVTGFSQQYSRNLYPSYEIDANSDVFSGVAKLTFEMNKDGVVVGQVTEGDTACAGDFELVK
jgi:outer membrane lipoprotein SlyB